MIMYLSFNVGINSTSRELWAATTTESTNTNMQQQQLVDIWRKTFARAH